MRRFLKIFNKRLLFNLPIPIFLGLGDAIRNYFNLDSFNSFFAGCISMAIGCIFWVYTQEWMENKDKKKGNLFESQDIFKNDIYED